MTVVNTLQVFINEELNANIRVVEIDGQPFFVAKDVCKALDIQNTTQAVAKLDDDEKAMLNIGLQGGATNYVNEYGLYNLILGSRKPEAKQFKRWITHDVLPSIIKHGIYATDDTIDKMINDPDFGIKLLKELKTEREKRIALEERVAVQGMQIAEMKPKAAYYDMILNCKDVIAITVISKDYGMSSKKMNKLLHELGVQFKQGQTWMLYQKHAEQGYTDTKTYDYVANDGSYKVTVHTYWTQKGRLFIYETLKKAGILPLIECEDKAA